MAGAPVNVKVVLVPAANDVLPNAAVTPPGKPLVFKLVLPVKEPRAPTRRLKVGAIKGLAQNDWREPGATSSTKSACPHSASLNEQIRVFQFDALVTA